MGHEVSRPTADERVGTWFGEYRIDALIGVGGMGQVYRALARDGTAVALKIVKDDLARDETFRRRFRREAHIAQTVENAHVVSVRDTGEQDGVPYLAAQFVEGIALDQRLEREGRLDLATTVRISAEVADGLQALADAGMVHRDVKPANILLDRLETAYITDFGLAKDRAGTVLTRPGQPLGSMDYMPPEQIRGEPVSAAADIYALACVVFECLHGQPPFADREGMGVLWAHLQDEPPDLAARHPEIPAGVARTVSKALEKDPAKRPAGPLQFARELSEAAGAPSAGPQS